MDEEPGINPLAQYELCQLRDCLDQILQLTKSALKHAATVAQAARPEDACEALTDIADALSAGADLATSYKRLLASGRAPDPEIDFDHAQAPN